MRCVACQAYGWVAAGKLLLTLPNLLRLPPQVTDAVHGAGGKIFAQLWHIGRVAHPQLQGGKPNLGPSAVCAAGGKFPQLPGQTGYVTPQAIDDPRTIIELYKVG